MNDQERFERIEFIIRRARATGNDRVLAEAFGLLAQLLSPAAEADVSQTSPDPMTRARAREAAGWPGGAGYPRWLRDEDGWFLAHSAADARDRRSPGSEGALHQLRKGRDRCGATRRDGEPCQAPAIEGSWVCRRHGGGSPQVRIRAGHTIRLQEAYIAHRDWEDARGTAGEFDALCKALAARRELEAYEVKLRLLSELRAELKRKRADRGTVRTSGSLGS